MKTKLGNPYFSLVLLLFLGLACANSSTLTPAPAEATPLLTEPPTSLATATVPPLPSPTATQESTQVLGYTQLGNGGSGGLADFTDVTLAFDLFTPGALFARGEYTADQSMDGGVTWQPVEPDKDLEQYREAEIYRVRRDPHTPTTLYGFSEASQSFAKSSDEGKTWAYFPVPFVDFIMSGIGILEIDPHNPDTLFVADMGSIYKSTDGGETWREITEGLPELRLSPFFEPKFIFDPSQTNTIYFLDKGIYGLYQSSNGGELWQQIPLPGLNLLDFVVNPQDSSTLYYLSLEGAYQSTDHGQTWQANRLGLPGEAIIQSLAIDPSSPATWYAILQEGAGKLYKSEDNGQSWNPVQPSGSEAISIQQLAIVPQTTGILYASSNTFGAEGLIHSTDGGMSWNWMVLPTPDDPIYTGGSVAFWAMDPQPPVTLYLGLTGTGAPTPTYVYKTTDSGETWTEIYQEYDLLNLVIAPNSPATLYFVKNPGFLGGTDSTVMKSADSGQIWQEMGILPARYNSYYGWLVVDPQNPNRLYISLGEDEIFISTSAAGSWQPANFGLPPGSRVDHLAIDPQTSTTLYAVLSGEAAGLFKSTDNGQTWKISNSGFPEGQVTALVIDPEYPTTLYLAISGYGVYRSLDGGESWSAVSPEPFIIPINALVLDPTVRNTLYLATADGLWVLRSEE
ncbi:MAG: hypothetical protein HUU38_26520 [Anaerolineales bacterium]|nr:hypothetical protein [Anaerolineales bacterium]